MRPPDAFLIVAEDVHAGVGVAVGGQSLDDVGAGLPRARLCFGPTRYVAPDFRSEGIAGRTAEVLFVEVRSGGYDRARLGTHGDNRPAQRLSEGRRLRPRGGETDDDVGERIVR
ncbi:MAG: hypothetical protein AVDCRST_MAG19-2325 [uncultured Thermomicrobiales bacterium]|uniref:N-acetyltransferase domain-containing protein n=1 Tax=uncultured Thermomicrobiales bacterium TaxID=1645740 RepID=A0A6J4V315_9BACT|nr:MAG: hypothetical protein AVDCRST_MAG19-2325 [uncultured Thermomicrobiales bacterium]